MSIHRAFVNACFTIHKLDVTWMQPGTLGILVTKTTTHGDAKHWMLYTVHPKHAVDDIDLGLQFYSRVPRGSCVTVLERAGQYVKVFAFVNGKTGWIEVDLVEQCK